MGDFAFVGPPFIPSRSWVCFSHSVSFFLFLSGGELGVNS